MVEKIKPITLDIYDIIKLKKTGKQECHWIADGAPQIKAGDVFWLKETWATIRLTYNWELTYALEDIDDLKGEKPNKPGEKVGGYPSSPTKDLLLYKANHIDEFDDPKERGFKWRSPAIMPRWASRMMIKAINTETNFNKELNEEIFIAYFEKI